MTFTNEEIEKEHLEVDYNDEWQVDDKDKTISIKFYGFEDRLRKFFNLKDDYGEDWIDCYAIIDPVNEYVTEIYISFTSNCDEPDRELDLLITNKPEGKMLLNNLLENDKNFGGFTSFYKEIKEEFKGDKI